MSPYFETGDPTGGLTWLPSDDLPSDAAPVEMFGMDTTRLPVAGPCDVWFGDDAA